MSFSICSLYVLSPHKGNIIRYHIKEYALFVHQMSQNVHFEVFLHFCKELDVGGIELKVPVRFVNNLKQSSVFLSKKGVLAE